MGRMPAKIGSVPFAVLLASFANPTFANPVLPGAPAPQADEVLSANVAYDRDSRTFFIGAREAAATASGGALVTFSRASDLVGRPVKFNRPIVTNLRSSGGLAALSASMPVSAAGMTSGFGMRVNPVIGGLRQHSGVDLAARAGSPIVATSDGAVKTAEWNGGYGLFVALDHGGGLQTRYGHMSRLNVSAGQRVRKGDVIGYVGSTGRSTGPHLHYEVRMNGQAVDPAPLLRSKR